MVKLIIITSNSNTWCLLVLLNLLLMLELPSVNGYQEILLKKCFSKADMQNVTINCDSDELIVIREAFFASSVIDQCPFVKINESSSTEKFQVEINNKLSCTDDLRLSLNSRCSGRSNCSLNLRKVHIDQCFGFDGWINIKYSCVSKSKFHSYCNMELKGNQGYVSNPGYPVFYPPYKPCKWKIKAYPGQKVQIDILDLSLKEPRFINKQNSECSDKVIIIEDNVKVFSMCGEIKTNLIEYRSKSNQLILDFISNEFSPTRGVLFKYSFLDCPTLRPPSNGAVLRNGSFAYYNCHFDYVFEDTGSQIKILFCEADAYWNGTVTRCVAKESLTTTIAPTEETEKAISHALIKSETHYPIVYQDHRLTLSQETGIFFLVIVILIALSVILTFVGILIHLRRKSDELIAV